MKAQGHTDASPASRGQRAAAGWGSRWPRAWAALGTAALGAIASLLLAAPSAFALGSAGAAPPRPAAEADRALVSLADGSLLLVDARRAQVLQRWPAVGPVAGAPQFHPDGRAFLVGTARGELLRLDLGSDRADAVRPGTALAGLALSADGRWLVAGFTDPAQVLLLDPRLQTLRQWPATSRDGKQQSPVAAVLDLPARRSVLVTLRDLPEAWEISYDERAEEIFDGLVHDYRMGEGVPLRGFLNPRRSKLPAPLGWPSADADQFQLLGSAGALARSQVLNLDVRKAVPGFAGAAVPAAATALAWSWDGHSRMLVARAGEPAADLLDMGAVQRLATLRWAGGHAKTVVGHPGRGLAWLALGPEGPTFTGLVGVDRRSAQATAPRGLPGAGRSAPAVTPDGCRLLVALGGPDGALLVLDSSDGRETGRLPLREPVAVWAPPPGPAAAHCPG